MDKEDFLDCLSVFADSEMYSGPKLVQFEVELREMIQRHGANMGEIVVLTSRILKSAIQAAV